VSGSGTSWAICKSASHSRQITMPAPTTHYSFTHSTDSLNRNELVYEKVSAKESVLAAVQWRLLGEREYNNVHNIHTHPFNGPLSRTTRVSWYQKGKTNLDFTGARDSEWQWHQLGRMQVCTSLQTDNHASTPPLSFLHAGCTQGNNVHNLA